MPEAPELSADCRVLLSLARKDSYIAYTRSILGRMGYAIVDLKDWQEDPSRWNQAPELCLVDELCAAQLPDGAPFDRLPQVWLTGRRGAVGDDPRVRGAICKPAGLHELYRLVQQVLENPPRTSLRVATNIPARLRLNDQEWGGSVLSLSSNGCLLRTTEVVPLGARLEIAFDLPNTPLDGESSVAHIQTTAETSYQVVPDLGLVFQATAPALRLAITDFVEQNLAH
jgi:hypothetical protein